ncbi:acyl dehydratase [Salibacterium salarium]|uniref:MaoC family dehydratase n=1 Tax=Salibacterium salarium TaxID=284579 RepID=UPI0027831B6E|nr:MaoC/PaaZ C-terminal domain-containing protein [Salibacterium salarium]MDQ0298926.1 acyl dehydratase [Salibacterium salarium]
MINSSWEGAKTDTKDFSITSEMINRWIKCVQDKHPIYTDFQTSLKYGYIDVVAPPTFPMSFWHYFFLPWMKQEDTVIHQKQMFIYYSPLTAGMNIKAWITLNEINTIKLSSGLFQRVRQTLSGAENKKLVFEAVVTTLIPLKHKFSKTSRKPKNIENIKTNADFHTSFSLECLQHYAKCSGDIQPIHLDERIARQKGFSRQVVHGMLIMGLVARLYHAKMNQGYIMRSFDMQFVFPLLRDENIFFLSKNQSPNSSLLKVRGFNERGTLIFTGTIQ